MKNKEINKVNNKELEKRVAFLEDSEAEANSKYLKETLENYNLKLANKELLEALKEAKRIIYQLSNGIEKRSEIEIQSIFDTVILKHNTH